MFSLKASASLGSQRPVAAVSSSTLEESGTGDVPEERFSAADYEERLARLGPEEGDALLCFPSGDVIVNSFPRGRPPTAQAPTLSPDQRGYLVTALARYTGDLVSVVHRSDHFDGKHVLSFPVGLDDVSVRSTAAEPLIDDNVPALEALDPALLDTIIRSTSSVSLSPRGGSSSKPGRAPSSPRRVAEGAGSSERIRPAVSSKKKKSKPQLASPVRSAEEGAFWFAACSPELTPTLPSDTRPIGVVPIPGSTAGTVHQVQVLVNVKQIELEDGSMKQLEPLFLSMFAFDVRSGERLTESVFLGSLNPPEVAVQLGSLAGDMSPELAARQVLFPLEALSPDVHLVFILEKTLRAATVDETMDEMLRYTSLKPAQRAKVDDEYRMSASRLFAYRQPLAWAARSLFENGRSLIGANIIVGEFARIKGGVMLDDHHLAGTLSRAIDKTGSRLPLPMAAAASSLRRPLDLVAGDGGSKRASFVPYRLVIDVDLVEPGRRVLPNLISPSLEWLHTVDPKVVASSPLIRVAQGFVKPAHVTEPNRDLVNDMFVFLDWVNFSRLGRRVSSISIRVTLHDTDRDLGAPGLEVFYGQLGQKLERSHLCSVQYQEKKVAAYEQIKFRLPITLSKKHHLLFTFSDLNCRVTKGTKKNAEDQRLENVFGYAIFPLFSELRVVEDRAYELPVAAASSVPTSHYLARASALDAGGLEYIDGATALFGFHTRLVSTLFTQDAVLDAWLNTPISGTFTTSCDVLSRSHPSSRIQFMSVIFDRLWEVMVVGDSASSSSALLEAAKLCDIVSEAGQRGMRSTLIRSENARNPHLVFYVQYEYREQLDSFEGESRSLDATFFSILLRRIQTQLKEGASAAAQSTVRSGNAVVGGSEALLSHLWFFLDLAVKSLVFYLNRSSRLAPGGPVSLTGAVPGTTLGSLLDIFLFLGKTIAQRIWLKGPLAESINSDLAWVLKDLLSLVDRGWCMEAAQAYVGVLGSGKDQVACGKLQWNFLRILADHPHFVALNLPVLHKVAKKVSASALLPSFYTHHFLAGLLVRQLQVAFGKENVVGSTDLLKDGVAVLRELLRKHAMDRRYQDGKLQMRVARMYFPLLIVVLRKVDLLKRLPEPLVRDMLISVLWVLFYADRPKLLERWWKGESLKLQRAFLTLLQLMLERLATAEHSIPIEYGNRVAQLVLGLATLFMKDLRKVLSQEDNKAFLDELFGVFVLLLQLRIPRAPFVKSLFAVLREFVLMFPQPLFVFADTSFYCGDLVFHLLQYMNVANGSVRAGASALLYLLIRQNFASRGNFNRVKLQATIAVSRFTGNTQESDTRLLQLSLEAVAARALEEYGKTDFSAEVEQVAKTLFRVIHDSARIHEFKADRERMCDYMYQVSLGYALDSPDLRLTWLSNLADYHLAALNYDEHAQCKLLAAALISQFLHMKDGERARRIGIPSPTLEAFVSVCPNVQKQPPLQAYLGPVEGTFESRQFSESSLVHALKQAISSLQRGQRYELAIQVHEILVTMLQYRHLYEEMASSFGEMSILTKKLLEAEAGSTRSFSSFYRVAFFGASWGADLNGKVFIYKADEFSRIADVTEQLEHQFVGAFPNVKVERLANKVVDDAARNEGVCYWQIASVQEFFDEDEVHSSLGEEERNQTSAATSPGHARKVGVAPPLHKRGSLLVGGARDHMTAGAAATAAAAVFSSTTLAKAALAIPAAQATVVPWHVRTSHWERKFNVRKFLLVQPFTKLAKGKAQSEGRPEEQWTRRTIYLCNHAFPFVNTRLQVVETLVQELTPIETAVEQISNQARQLIKESKQCVANQLQRVLQGAILTQVNVGIVHTARVFLKEPSADPNQSQYLPKLAAALKQFCHAAEEAIAVNRRLIGSEQLELQAAFEDGFAQMKSDLKDLGLHLYS